MSYDLLDRVYSIMIDVMTGVSAGSGNAVFYNTDSHTSFIEVSITNGTQSFNMSEYNYQLVISKPDKTGYNNSYTTTDNSKLVIALDSDMLSGIGNNIAQLYVMKTINDVNKVVTMIEFNYTVKAGNYSALAPESVNQDSMYIALRTDVDSILSKIENGELGGGSGGTGLTATQAEQLATAYNHSQSPHITTADVNNAVSTYVNAHKEELKGDKGDKGDAGEKGDTGAKGDKGDKGDTGAKGANGITPTLKVGSTSTGNAGTNASVTMTDNNNVYTLNFVIPKGEKGDKGAAGAKGQDGAKGADGITPTLRVGTVTTLAAGSNATVTMSENNNVYTLNFGIPKGNKGDTGASGGSGETTVINPTITIGTVTNGDTASATITGDSPNYTLNLVLPKGAKGDKGDKGDTGAKGEKGATGAKGDAGAKGADGITPTIAVGTTTTGEAGTNANVTMSKSGTTYTFNFVIPKGAKGDTGAAGTNGAKGDKGDKGEKGDTGAKGADGVTPTFTVGTVSTGAAGSTAIVTITGTAPNYVLNFTIPKGDKGDAGEAGSGGDVDLTGYAELTGATFTGNISSPIVAATRYFVTPTLVGEGDDSKYFHRVVFGHRNFDKMEFHEYGGLFRFLENKNGGVNDGRLLFQISASGVDSSVDLKERGVRVYSPNNKPTAADLGIATGTNGATFTPSVDDAGNLSWSNDKDLANPNTVNIKGAKGDKGDKGEKGNTGDTGAKGDKGDPFTYADFTSEQLTALKGAKGAKGDRGEKGADGVTPTLSIGTVTTGAAGSSASVTIGGTAPSYVLNFTIPKGDKGDKGDTGAAGSGGSSSGGIAFEDSYVSDANLWLTNGYTKTSGTSTLNLPSVCTDTRDKWGILFFIAENARNGTGTQMFFPIDGAYKGKIFTRSIVNRNQISSWIMLASKDDITEAVNGAKSKTVKTLTSASSVTLATDEYQYLYGNMDMTLALPNITTTTDITELHLFYLPNAVRTLTFSNSNIKWQNSVPNIEANKWYEFIFTRTHTGVWLAGVVVYG